MWSMHEDCFRATSISDSYEFETRQLGDAVVKVSRRVIVLRDREETYFDFMGVSTLSIVA